MDKTDCRLSGLDKVMDRIIENNPHVSGIINAFRAVIIERNRLAGDLKIKALAPDEIERMRLDTGTPVIKQTVLFRPEDPLETIALSLIPAFNQGLPDLQGDLDKLQDCILKKTIHLYDYLEALPDNGKKIIDRWSAELNIRPAALLLVLKTVIWVILHKRKKEIADRFGEFEWEKGYCPICGSFPSISVIKEKNAQRWLHCCQCGHDWRFSRVICPYCGHEGQKGMTFYFLEERKQESVYTCDQCKRYLVTLNPVSDLFEMDLDISALGLAHLDILMQDKGFIPMAPAEWNMS